MNLPRTVHNWLSYLGAAITAIALIVFVALFALYITTGAAQPYAGLVLFILIPAVVLAGLLLIPLGMLVEWRHQKRTGQRSIPRLPQVDLNNPAHRNATIIFGCGVLFVTLFAALVSLEAFQYTESPSFCGELCHNVMRPEYVTYRQSPHARIACVSCHVGPGATWYVRSKLAGLHQVYATLFDRFPRPIPSPIEDLRPAQETCQGCHWPRQFWGGLLIDFSHFLSDSSNSPWQIQLNVKIGGGDPRSGPASGIHWHMDVSSRIEYFAPDAQRQNIEWIRYTDLETGATRVYTAAGATVQVDTLPESAIRTMDCIDCHNRPTHILRSPGRSLDLALAAGEIDPSLPYIKRTAVQALTQEYASRDSAMSAIERSVRHFYAENYPDLAARDSQKISASIAVLREIYRNNYFPDMKVRWDVYPENNKHLIFKGCFRCHDEKHNTPDGRAVTRECTSCHVILAQGRPGALEQARDANGLTFRHPVDIGGMWRQVMCPECHSGSSSG
ncbi:MAG: NapC/NirT family cytochrome c [Gemmatimonadales bacterium]|jgi:hypothetical protein